MTEDKRRSLDHEFAALEQRLPRWIARWLSWMRTPESRYVRIPASIALIVGGFVGFLPVLGFWMIPLGLLLLAQDVPALRPLMRRLLAWINRKWPARASRDKAAE